MEGCGHDVVVCPSSSQWIKVIEQSSCGQRSRVTVQSHWHRRPILSSLTLLPQINANVRRQPNKKTTKMSDSPRPVVVCGPSGVGKGTLIEMLMKKFSGDQFGFSVSHTTRQPRPGEEDGVHYNFSTVEAMKKEIDEGKFIESAEVHGKYYGTSVAAVESVQKSGKICILDIDVQGAQSVKKSSLDPIYMFISPPSQEELEKRLRGRGTESEESVQKRLGAAAKELEYGQQDGNFDRIFVNDDLQKTFDEICVAFKEWYPHLKE